MQSASGRLRAALPRSLYVLHQSCPAFPNRVNVEFIQIVDRGHIRQRTWERGTGETLACGSGACAVAVVCMLRDVVDREVRIELRGGDLHIAWPHDSHIEMTGPAVEVYSGRIPIGETLGETNRS